MNRDLDIENSFAITNWGYGVDFLFVWNKEDNTLRVSDFGTGYSYGSYGEVRYIECSNYFGSDYEPSYYENGVFHFHVAAYVEAGSFGDFWETFTLDNLAGLSDMDIIDGFQW